MQAAGRPRSFLHASKPEIDLPPGTDPYSPAVYAKGAENFRRMIEAGVLVRDAAPGYYVYRMNVGAHEQTGVVVAASIAAYDAGRIRKHEFTRPDKEDDRVRQIEALNAQTGPVLLAHPDAPAVDALLARAAAGAPEADVMLGNVRHRIWKISGAAEIAALSEAFEAMPALYIADGHHRSAAASRVAASRRARAGHEAFLAVSFPASQMRILCYNRVVRDLNGLIPQAFLQRVGEAFVVSPSINSVAPEKHGEYGLYVDGHWYQLVVKPDRVPADPVERLDVSLLSNHILGPVLGIHDLRTDKRIDFVGGIRGNAELEKRVNSGEMAAAFSLHATSMQDLMAVTDASQVMPPKSTWFEPKLADGLVSLGLD